MIKEIRILPPLGIARLGSSESPMDNYRLTTSDDPEGFRSPTPQPTLQVEDDHVVAQTTPDEVKFRDDSDPPKIRPVCPFFDVWARMEGSDVLVPLTKAHLEDAGLNPETDVEWKVEVGNLKAFRRTGVENDKILADTGDFTGHDSKNLDGRCENFVGGVTGESIPFGKVQYLRPTEDFPEIRLRFTPAEGNVYGPTGRGADSNVAKAVYDTGPGRGTWHLHLDGAAGTPQFTNPAGIYAQKRNEFGQLVSEDGTVITPDNGLSPVNLGYLDDACDGIITVKLRGLDEVPPAVARVTVGPPDFAPDSLPVRTVADDLEQMIAGAQINGAVTVSEAAEILRRAFESVRLMNTVVMNGRGGLAGHLRFYDPNLDYFWERSTQEQTDQRMDQRRVKRQHSDALDDILADEQVLFDVDDMVRESVAVGDLSSTGLQQMPAMMRGSDGMAMTLTKRQHAKLKEGEDGLSPDPASPAPGSIEAVNLTAQATRIPGSPNPVSAYPDTAISNCFPGLELDFRNVWRRIFEEIVLHESQFLVFAVNPSAPAPLQNLQGAIILSVDGQNVYSEIRDSQSPPQLVGHTNLEWTNSLAHIVKRPGEQVQCRFQTETGNVTHTLTIRNLFDRATIDGVMRETAAIASDVLDPGELTQGLCSPWQADFRECGCYYWAASRPDYVNAEVVDGVTRGHDWLLKRDSATPKDAPRDYDRHPYQDTITYDDLYQAWEQHLTFILEGKDA